MAEKLEEEELEKLKQIKNFINHNNSKLTQEQLINRRRNK